MNESDIPTVTPETPEGTPASQRGWRIAVAVLAFLLVAAIVFIVIRVASDDGEDTASSASTTTAPAPESSLSEPYDVDCDPAELLAAIPADVVADGASVSDYQCAPATEGSDVQAYAWAQLDAPGVEPATVFFAGTAADDPDVPNAMDWEMLAYGTDVVCLDVVPAETCDLLPGAPRSRDGSGSGSAGSSSTPPAGGSSGTSSGPADAPAVVYDLQCTAADLLASVQPDVLAQGATVTDFACTPSSLDRADTAFAYLRAEAPNVDPIYVLFAATAVVEPGTPTVIDWDPIDWGSAVVCDERLPAATCDQLPRVPRG